MLLDSAEFLLSCFYFFHKSLHMLECMTAHMGVNDSLGALIILNASHRLELIPPLLVTLFTLIKYCYAR